MTSLKIEHPIDAHKKPTHLKYRPDIDGLRALAVIPVILFHAGLTLFGGGYLGVDVFFVISGYLITSIIIKEKQKNAFTLSSFYSRRAKRILPVLLVVIIFTTIAAWNILPPKELDYFAQSVIATLTFSSNILFWLQSGYFDTATELKPLLHTWSLAVEEQYYIVFPLIILTLWNFGRKSIVAFTFFLVAASMAFSFWFASVDQIGSFYLLPARAWEILAGAMVALVGIHTTNRRTSQLASALGIVLILAPMIIYSSDTAQLPLYALPTVIGTVLVIQFTKAESITYRLLTLRPLIWVGLISYSAYLWHQPLLAFAKFRYSHELPVHIIALAITATLALSVASYKLIENPTRTTKGLKSKLVICGVCICAVSISGIAYFGHKYEGFPSRVQQFFSLEAQAFEKDLESKFVVDSQDSPHYRSIAPPKQTILIIGDSYVRNWSVGLNENIDHSKYRVISINFLHCEVTMDNGTITSKPMEPYYEKNCKDFATYTNDREILNSVTKIFLVSHRPFEYIANLFRFDVLAALQNKTRASAYIFGNYYQLDPQKHATCMSAMIATFRGPEVCVEQSTFPHERQQFTSSAVPQNLRYTFVDVIDLLCSYNRSQCPASYAGVPYLIEDWNHLSMSFVKLMFMQIGINRREELNKLGLGDVIK